jgi:hypothetical protein
MSMTKREMLARPVVLTYQGCNPALARNCILNQIYGEDVLAEYRDYRAMLAEKHHLEGADSRVAREAATYGTAINASKAEARRVRILDLEERIEGVEVKYGFGDAEAAVRHFMNKLFYPKWGDTVALMRRHEENAARAVVGGGGTFGCDPLRPANTRNWGEITMNQARVLGILPE